MNNKSVTIVSCYYKVPSKHSSSKYEEWIDNFLKDSSFNIIIFTSYELMDFFSKYHNQNKNVILVIKEFEELRIYKEYKTIWDYQHHIDDQKNIRTKDCYVIWNSKLDFLKEAIELNPFKSDKFIWNDIGAVRDNLHKCYLIKYPKYDLISNDKIDIIMIKDFDNYEQKYFQDEIHFSGMYGGSIKDIMRFHDLYYKMFDKYLKNGYFIGCDQQLISSVYLENKDLFNPIETYNYDWFYLLKHYSFIDTKYAVFITNGRLGNAIFRYLAISLFCMKYGYEYRTINDLFDVNYYFNFYKGVDHIGNDMEYTNDDINNLLYKVITDKDVMGFNTLGYLKNKIDISQLKSNEYINNINGLNHGIYVKNCLHINDNNLLDNYYDKSNNFDKNKNIIFNDFYQLNDIYLENKKEILEYINKNKDNPYHYVTTYNEKIYIKDLIVNIQLNSSKIYDVAIHIRLDDFNGRVDFIEVEYYIKLFDKIKEIEFKKKENEENSLIKIAIITDNVRSVNDMEYINALLKWFKNNGIDVKIETNDLITDFNIMKQSSILICGMSTLAWTACYLSSNIKKCYMPNYNFCSTDRVNTYFKKPIENTVFYDVKTTKFKNTKAIIITLKECNIRMKNVDKLKDIMNRLGIQYEIFYGIYGKDIKIYNTNVEEIKALDYNGNMRYCNTKVRLNGQMMGMGELGCAWTHINIYDKLVSAENEIDNYLIFEDDAEMNEEDIDYLYKLLDNMPQNYDVLHIAKSDCYDFIKKDKVNEYYYTIEKRFFNRLTAYIVSKNGANKLLRLTENCINIPADDLLSNNFLMGNIDVFVPERYVFYELENIESTIKIINDK